MRALWRATRRRDRAGDRRSRSTRYRRAGARGDLGDAEPELLVDHHDLAARDRLAVDQQVDGLAGEPVEGHDRAGPERERLADRHARAADLDRELDRHVVQALELGRAAGRLGGPDRGLEGNVVDWIAHLTEP